MSKAYSYLRFSTPEQQQGDSFRRQTTLAAEYARKNGLQLDTDLTFQDLGVSAYRSKNARKGALRVFLDAVEDGEIEAGSYLLVESLDRISRDQILAAQGLFLQIIQAGITLVTLADQRVYSASSINANPTDLIISLVSMMRANEESATKSRRLTAAWSAKRAKAAEKPLTSVCPAWLRLDSAAGRFEIIPERAAVVQRIYAEAAAGRGQNAIATELNRDGVPVFGHRGRQGTQWHRSYVVKILSNPAVIGTGIPHRMEEKEGRKHRVPLEAVPNYFPSVVADDIYHRVQALRSGGRQPLRGRHAGGPVANVLGGLARCPLCASAMTRITKGGHWHYLVCTKAKAGAGCVYRAVRYQTVEDAVLLNRDALTLGCPTGASDETRVLGRMDQIGMELDALREVLANLMDNARRVRSPTIAADILEHEQQIEELQAEQRRLAEHAALVMPARLASRLDAFDSAAKSDPLDRGAVNAALRALLTRVVVNYRTGHLEFEWQHGGEVHLMFAWPDDGSKAEA